MNFFATEYFKQANLGLVSGGNLGLMARGKMMLPPRPPATNLGKPASAASRPNVIPQATNDTSAALASPPIRPGMTAVKTASFNCFSALAYFAAFG